LAEREGPVQEKSVVLLGEVFPADPLLIDGLLRRMGVTETIFLPGRSIEDFRRSGRMSAMAPLHPFYKESMNVARSIGMSIAGGAPVGISGTYAWIKSIGSILGLDEALVQQVADEERAKATAIVAARPLNGTVLVTGYEGTELAYARMLVEAGAHVPYVSTSIGQDPLVLPDELWLKSHGTKEVIYRKALEEDVAAIDRYSPDLVFGTTPLASVAKERGIPAMYFTNQLASRPFFLSSGMAATIEFVAEVLTKGDRYRFMQEFFADEK
jgi:chlorophyllide a reductase subunit Y